MNILATRIRDLVQICRDSTRLTECTKEKDLIVSLLNLSTPIIGSISQYSGEFNGDGISSCTTMAIFTSLKLLEILNKKEFNEIKPEFIDSNVRSSYVLFKSKTNDVESHQDVDTVINDHNLFTLFHGYMDGFMNGLNNLNDLNSSIINIYTDELNNLGQSFDNIDKTKYVSLVITKGVETFAILIPPNKLNLPFFLFDSHPRTNLDGSYIICFYSEKNLFDYLSNNIMKKIGTSLTIDDHKNIDTLKERRIALESMKDGKIKNKSEIEKIKLEIEIFNQVSLQETKLDSYTINAFQV